MVASKTAKPLAPATWAKVFEQENHIASESAMINSLGTDGEAADGKHLTYQMLISSIVLRRGSG
jgi:hypothetical protein